MSKVYNFSAGPSMLPEEVMLKVQKEFLNYNGIGASVIEISHRSKDYIEIAEEATQNLRDLMNIPDNYQVLFMHGGGRGLFAGIPLNIASGKGSADYVVTGAWSGYAADEALKYTGVNRIEATKTLEDGTITVETANLPFSKDAEFAHYCLNETIHGIDLYDTLDCQNNNTVVDVSSCFLSRPIDVTKYGIVYGGAQKNIGPSGITIAIVRDDLVGRAREICPSILDFSVLAKNASMYNTPNTFAWYFAGEVFKWLKQLGGVEAMEKMNIEKANYLYGFIDSCDFYKNKIDPKFRSRMNVPFNLKDEALNAKFLEEAKQNNLISLKGHRVLGGMRASIYNAMPMEGVKSLVNFMEKFAKENN